MVDAAPVGRFDDRPRKIRVAESGQKLCVVGELHNGSDAWTAIADVDPVRVEGLDGASTGQR